MNVRITPGGIEEIMNLSRVEKRGFCEISPYFEGLSENRKKGILISAEDGTYEKLALLEEKIIPSRLEHIKLALEEKSFYVEYMRLQIIKFPFNSWIYTGTLYKSKKWSG